MSVKKILKGNVANTNLLGENQIRFSIYNIENWLMTNAPVTLTIVNDATFSNGSKVMELNGNKNVTIADNAKAEIIASNKFAFISLRPFEINFDDLKFCNNLQALGKLNDADAVFGGKLESLPSSITEIRFAANNTKNNIKGNINNLKFAKTASYIRVLASDYLYGDISAFSNNPNLTYLDLTACTNITGSVSALKATCPKLKTVIVTLTQCVE